MMFLGYRAVASRALMHFAYHARTPAPAWAGMAADRIRGSFITTGSTHSWRAETSTTAGDRMMLTFEEFVKTQLQSFSHYQKDPAVRALVGDDMGALKRAYDSYCKLSYNSYTKSHEGGTNPSRMI